MPINRERKHKYVDKDKKQDKSKNKRKVTAEDMPGSGMAKKAAKELEGRQKQIDRELKKALGQ